MESNGSVEVIINVLADDEERADRELKCFNYCVKQAETACQKEDLRTAAGYYDNAVRSLRALDSMQDAKRKIDQAHFILNQIKGQRQIDELLSGMSTISRLRL